MHFLSSIFATGLFIPTSATSPAPKSEDIETINLWDPLPIESTESHCDRKSLLRMSRRDFMRRVRRARRMDGFQPVGEKEESECCILS